MNPESTKHTPQEKRNIGVDFFKSLERSKDPKRQQQIAHLKERLEGAVFDQLDGHNSTHQGDDSALCESEWDNIERKAKAMVDKKLSREDDLESEGVEDGLLEWIREATDALISDCLLGRDGDEKV